MEKERIEGILNNTANFYLFPFYLEQKQNILILQKEKKMKTGKVKRVAVDVPNYINNTAPAWTKKPKDLKDEDYSSFYRELYPMTFDQPLFHIHLNVDYPFNLTGILYFPKIKENGNPKEQDQLVFQSGFITDNVEEIVPEFLTLLHGVLILQIFHWMFQVLLAKWWKCKEDFFSHHQKWPISFLGCSKKNVKISKKSGMIFKFLFSTECFQMKNLQESKRFCLTKKHWGRFLYHRRVQRKS